MIKRMNKPEWQYDEFMQFITINECLSPEFRFFNNDRRKWGTIIFDGNEETRSANFSILMVFIFGVHLVIDLDLTF